MKQDICLSCVFQPACAARTCPHDEFNGARKVSLLDRTHHDHCHCSDCDRCRGVRAWPAAQARRRGRGRIALGRRCAQRRAPDRGLAAGRHHRSRCGPASRSGSRRAGIPIGAIRAMPAYRRSFDFAGSHNVKAIDVLWPAPRSACRKRAASIGYDRDVILPLRVVPQDARQAGRAAPEARLRGLRETVRAGRSDRPT